MNDQSHYFEPHTLLWLYLVLTCQTYWHCCGSVNMLHLPRHMSHYMWHPPPYRDHTQGKVEYILYQARLAIISLAMIENSPGTLTYGRANEDGVIFDVLVAYFLPWKLRWH